MARDKTCEAEEDNPRSKFKWMFNVWLVRFPGSIPRTGPIHTTNPQDHGLLAPTHHLLARMDDICWTLVITPALYIKNTAHHPAPKSRDTQGNATILTTIPSLAVRNPRVQHPDNPAVAPPPPPPPRNPSSQPTAPHAPETRQRCRSTKCKSRTAGSTPRAC